MPDNGSLFYSSGVGPTGTASNLVSNIGLSTSVATNALTVTLTDAAGNTPSQTSTPPVAIGFRSATATSGTVSSVQVSAATSIVVPSGTTIGTVSTAAAWIYVYAVNNAGTVVIGLSLNQFDEGSLQTTTAISGGASASTLYTTSLVSNAAVRLIGRIKITEATAGTWVSNATEVANLPFLQLQTFAPTIQKFASSTGTYTTPTAPYPAYIRVEMVAGGGSGASGGATQNPGAAGNNTTFGTSLLTCNGGAGGPTSGAGTAGGSATINAPAIGIAVTGGSGCALNSNNALGTGGAGGNTPFGGAGSGGVQNTPGATAATNTGAGGGGGGSSVAVSGAAGGSAGGYIKAIIAAPASTYAYSVGAASIGATGTNAGGNGSAGLIVVTEYYQ